MNFLPLTLYLALILSVVISCVAAVVIARRYRRRMQELMTRSQAGAARAAVPDVAFEAAIGESSPPTRLTLADNRAAGIRLTMLLIALSLLISTTGAYIWMSISFEEPMRPRQFAVVALLHTWPVIPALALLWRWTLKRLFGVLLLWCVFCFFIFLWRQIEFRPMEALLGIAVELSLPLVLVSLVFLGNATRAVAPWLFVPVVALMWTSLMSVDVLMYFAGKETPWLMSILVWMMSLFGTNAFWVSVVVAFVLPWLLLWWPARMLGRALGRAYSRKWFSDLLVVFSGVWAISLADRALTSAGSAGLESAWLVLPLLWIPLVMWVTRRWRPMPAHPPTLLVLRVFQKDAQSQLLFDQVVERWRLSGNTLITAGTDLADRTLDADDIFQFLDGKLAERFVNEPADVARRISAFDMAPDIDGRFRVNECYCHDSTWELALQALVSRSDVVLMDLRGFQEKNRGCATELTTLATGARELRVVLLVDARTDRVAACKAIAPGREERFKWIEAGDLDRNKRREVLASLFPD
jgi:hypothetical protein